MCFPMRLMAIVTLRKREGGGCAAFEINEQHAAVVKQVFQWVGRDRISIGEVKRRLDKQEILTPNGQDLVGPDNDLGNPEKPRV